MLHRHSMTSHSLRFGRGSGLIAAGVVLTSIFRVIDRLGGLRRVLVGAALAAVAVVVCTTLVQDPSVGSVAGRLGGLAIGVGVGALGVLIVWFGFWWVMGYLLLLLGAIRLLVVTMLAPVVQLALLALALVATIPVSPIRRGAVRLTTLMSTSIGDSFAFVDASDAHERIVARVRDAVGHASATCRSLVVVAHSQGCAVTERALRFGAPPNLAAFVTLGSGLSKLSQLQHSSRARIRLVIGAVVRTVVIGMGAVLIAIAWQRGWEISGSEPGDDPTPAALVIALMLAMFLAMWGVFVHYRASMITSTVVRELTEGPRPWRWTDLYAENDLVPDGPLDVDRRIADSVEVTNEGSVLTDHVTYHHNPQVLDLITSEIEIAARSEQVLAYSDHDRAVLSIERTNRTALRRLSYASVLVVISLTTAMFGRLIGMAAWTWALIGALVATPFAGLPWHRWHERATTLEFARRDGFGLRWRWRAQPDALAAAAGNAARRSPAGRELSAHAHGMACAASEEARRGPSAPATPATDARRTPRAVPVVAPHVGRARRRGVTVKSSAKRAIVV